MNSFKELISMKTASPFQQKMETNFKDLIENFNNVKWQAVTKKTLSTNRISDFALLVSFNKKKSYATKNTAPQPKLIVRMGGSVPKMLGWEIGDKLMFAYDEDNPTIMCLVKASNGFKLAKDANTHVCRVQIPAEHLLDLEEIPQREVMYEMDKKNKRLFFKFDYTAPILG